MIQLISIIGMDGHSGRGRWSRAKTTEQNYGLRCYVKSLILETSLVYSTPKGRGQEETWKFTLRVDRRAPSPAIQRMLAAGWAALRSMGALGPVGAPRASLQQLRGLRGGQHASGWAQSKESQASFHSSKDAEQKKMKASENLSFKVILGCPWTDCCVGGGFPC